VIEVLLNLVNPGVNELVTSLIWHAQQVRRIAEEKKLWIDDKKVRGMREMERFQIIPRLFEELIHLAVKVGVLVIVFASILG
jgi:hypothetical protein